MTENRRIFWNVVATYGRSLYSLVCGLFTARWVLMTLGEVDYGLIGVVGGAALGMGRSDAGVRAPDAGCLCRGVGARRKRGRLRAALRIRLWSGQALLDYARKHPEIEWVFKPHPKLRQRLVEIGYMTIAEVDAYYRAWEQVGTACYDGDYARYFLKSRAMITDSNSFLMEYMAVGQPLIHLVPRDDNTLVCREAEAVFRTFYVAHDEEELAMLLRLVVEERGIRLVRRDVPRHGRPPCWAIMQAEGSSTGSATCSEHSILN